MLISFWFTEFWEDHFKCRYPNSSLTPYNSKYEKFCTTKERLKKGDMAFENQLQFVSDAVLAFAYAFRWVDIFRFTCSHISALFRSQLKPCEISKQRHAQGFLSWQSWIMWRNETDKRRRTSKISSESGFWRYARWKFFLPSLCVPSTRTFLHSKVWVAINSSSITTAMDRRGTT